MSESEYTLALARLDRRVNLERARDHEPAGGGYGTVRMQRLLESLDNPHRAAPVIHIAGTKGKGSTAQLAAALLLHRGLSVGRYLSPHVVDLRERIAVNGDQISESAFVAAFERVDAAARRDEECYGEAPTWFEFLTAVAFVAFREAKVGAVVLETGLGGRLDATNVADLPAVVCGITPISLDHQQILGDTLGAIADEKAGILRPDADLVFGRQPVAAGERLFDRAAGLGASPLVVGIDYDAVPYPNSLPPAPDHPEQPQWLDIRTPGGVFDRVPLRLLGRHQADNAALAVALADCFLKKTGRTGLSARTARAAWRRLKPLSGRIDVAARRPWTVVDGAHNPASAWALAETVRERFAGGPERRTLVFAVAADKDWPVLLRILAPLAARTILTGFDSPRCLPAATAAAWMERSYPEADCRVIERPDKALSTARREAGKDGLVLVTGSLYLAGAAYGALRPPQAQCVGARA